MPRKISNPKLKGSKIKISKSLGKGQGGGLSPKVRRAIIREPGTKRKVYAAMKKLAIFGETYKREDIAQGQVAWKAFYRAGLPVPKFSKVELRKGHEHYLAVFMEDMVKKHGRIIDGHELGQPVFLRKLSVERNGSLIKNLAKDLATMHNIGFTTRYLDFWHYYKNRKGKWNRVILDFNGFEKEFDKNVTITRLRHNITHAKEHFGKREFMLFFEEYLKHYKGKHRNVAIESSKA